MTRTHPAGAAESGTAPKLHFHSASAAENPPHFRVQLQDGPGRRFWVAELNWNRLVWDWEQPAGAGHGASLNALGRERSSVLGGSRVLATVS